MTAETLLANLIAVLPDTEILVRDGEGREFRVSSVEVSAGGTERDSVFLHCTDGFEECATCRWRWRTGSHERHSPHCAALAEDRGESDAG